MVDSAALAFYVILQLLSWEGAPSEIVEDNICNLHQLSEGIAIESQSEDELLDLLAVGFEESRYSYRGRFVVSRRGACGVFQQIPRYAEPSDLPRPSCRDLQDPYIGAFRAVSALRLLREKFGEDRFCHYNAGNICRSRSFSYQGRIYKLRRRIRLLLASSARPQDQALFRHFLRTKDLCEMLTAEIQ